MSFDVKVGRRLLRVLIRMVGLIVIKHSVDRVSFLLQFTLPKNALIVLLKRNLHIFLPVPYLITGDRNSMASVIPLEYAPTITFCSIVPRFSFFPPISIHVCKLIVKCATSKDDLVSV